jgi:cytochrome c biogenesis protein CcmG/thiol:disulfide interchange protein DsbE
MRFMIPLGIFFVMCLFLAIGLKLDPRNVPSPLIGKPVPAFSLPLVQTPERLVSQEDFRGEVTLFNVWSSWCVACRQEHALLVALAGRKLVSIVGLNYKDERDAAMDWLARLGNPYRYSVFDAEGKTGIELGVYGVPETFVVDRKGFIRYKQIGPITESVLEGTLLPLIRQLQAEAP